MINKKRETTTNPIKILKWAFTDAPPLGGAPHLGNPATAGPHYVRSGGLR